MSAINENLKLIREAKGYTQEEIAKQMKVTRQTISSYETNRTQPDIETLKRFAVVYDVEFNDILYGRNKMQVKRRVIKLIAFIALIDLLICNLAQSVLILAADTYFHVEEGAINESNRLILNTRFAILNARNAIQAFSVISFSVLSIVLLVQLIALERPVSMRTKLKYLATLVIGSAITILPWTFFDNFYGLLDYSYIAIKNLLFVIIMFGLSIIGERIHKKFGCTD